MKRIVMVCTGNTCRSPMAEALMIRALRRRGIKDIDVQSAGTSAWDGAAASMDSVLIMADEGIDLQGHRSQSIRRELIDGALVLCMTDGHAQSVLRMHPDADVHVLTEYAGLRGGIRDPFGFGFDAYRAAFREIEEAVEKIADQIRDDKQSEKGM